MVLTFKLKKSPNFPHLRFLICLSIRFSLLWVKPFCASDLLAYNDKKDNNNNSISIQFQNIYLENIYIDIHFMILNILIARRLPLRFN